MLYFDRINVSEGIDVNKTCASEEWYFSNYNFKYQSNLCSRSYDLSVMSMNLIDNLNFKGCDYSCIICLNEPKMRL